MPGVSKEQIAAAKQMTAIEFLRRFRPNELVRSGSRGEFQLREHDSFKINGESSIWHWKSRDIGGKSALDYLIKVEGMKFVACLITYIERKHRYGKSLCLHLHGCGYGSTPFEAVLQESLRVGIRPHLP